MACLEADGNMCSRQSLREEDEEQWVQQLMPRLQDGMVCDRDTGGYFFSEAKFREQGGRSEGARIFGMGGSAKSEAILEIWKMVYFR